MVFGAKKCMFLGALLYPEPTFEFLRSKCISVDLKYELFTKIKKKGKALIFYFDMKKTFLSNYFFLTLCGKQTK